MARSKQPADGAETDASAKNVTPEPVSAFDLWLDRGLHKLFDTIAQEPVPEALLQIIEQDRKKQ